MKHVLLTFETDRDAVAFMESFASRKEPHISGQSAEILAMDVCEATTVERVDVPVSVTNPAGAVAKIPELIATLKTIENMINAPHWTTERKYKIRDLARSAWVKF